MIKINGKITVKSVSEKDFIKDIQDFLKSKNADFDGVLEIVPEQSEDIYAMDMSIRLRNILMRYKIYSLNDISNYTIEEVMLFRGMGQETYNELNSVLGKRGIKLHSYLEETKDFSKGFSKEERLKIFKADIRMGMKDVLNLTVKELGDIFGERSTIYEKLLKKRLEYIRQQKI